MSQLRQEDSGNIVSMFHRHGTDNGSMSATSADDERTFSLNNVVDLSESTGQLSNPSQMMEESAKKDSESCSEVVPKCPVCGRSLQSVAGSELLLNKHVDECLNRVAVGELLASEKAQSSSVSR